MGNAFDLYPATSLTGAYATRTQLEAMFGRDNVRVWADINNTRNANDITSRVNWALVLASGNINDALRGGPYRVPFEEPYPDTLIEMTCRYAGVLLYESRGMSDSDDPLLTSMTPNKDEVLRWISRVLSGQLQLPVDSHATRVPQSVVHREKLHRVRWPKVVE